MRAEVVYLSSEMETLKKNQINSKINVECELKILQHTVNCKNKGYKHRSTEIIQFDK